MGTGAVLLYGEGLALLGTDDVESTSSTAVDDPVVRDGPTSATCKGSRGGAVTGGVYNSPVEFKGLGRGVGGAMKRYQAG